MRAVRFTPASRLSASDSPGDKARKQFRHISTLPPPIPTTTSNDPLFQPREQLTDIVVGRVQAALLIVITVTAVALFKSERICVAASRRAMLPSVTSKSCALSVSNEADGGEAHLRR